MTHRLLVTCCLAPLLKGRGLSSAVLWEPYHVEQAGFRIGKCRAGGAPNHIARWLFQTYLGWFHLYKTLF